MAYAAQSDLTPLRLTQAELVQLTCDDPSGEVNVAVVSAALEEASGIVDSYCRARYTTPLQADDDVKGKTIDIAMWLLLPAPPQREEQRDHPPGLRRCDRISQGCSRCQGIARPTGGRHGAKLDGRAADQQSRSSPEIQRPPH